MDWCAHQISKYTCKNGQTIRSVLVLTGELSLVMDHGSQVSEYVIDVQDISLEICTYVHKTRASVDT